MKPKKPEFEKVSTNDFIVGNISDIQYEQEHVFKGFGGKPDTKNSAVRFIFTLDGYHQNHYSRWMRFSYGEKTNLYTKYIVSLVENAKPDLDFDLDALKGMKVKILWNEKNGFQSVETIRPFGQKIPNDISETVEYEDDQTTEITDEMFNP